MVDVALALGYYANFKMTDFLEPPMVAKIGTLWNMLMLYIIGKEIYQMFVIALRLSIV